MTRRKPKWTSGFATTMPRWRKEPVYPNADLKRRIRDRFATIRSAYEDFIKRHPDHAPARVAYGSFLNDLSDEEGAQEQWEKALSLNPADPAVYNNLANVYGHMGPLKKAFEYYTKAIELNPLEPVYYNNFGTTVFLFRKDAREFYGITEQQVFDKALELYSQALKLDPTNFLLASDVAQTYYGIKPPRLEEALKAWTNTLALARDEIEREGVYIHFARLKLQAERLKEVRAHLNAVTNDMYAVLKNRITLNLEEAERKAKGTNSPPAEPTRRTDRLSQLMARGAVGAVCSRGDSRGPDKGALINALLQPDPEEVLWSAVGAIGHGEVASVRSDQGPVVLVADCSVPPDQLMLRFSLEGWTETMTGGFTVTVVVLAAEVQPPTVTVTLYMPAVLVVAFAIEGFWLVEMKPFGPVQL